MIFPVKTLDHHHKIRLMKDGNHYFGAIYGSDGFKFHTSPRFKTLRKAEIYCHFYSLDIVAEADRAAALGGW